MPEVPASQKPPITSSAPANANVDSNAPKADETGSKKDAATGSTSTATAPSPNVGAENKTATGSNATLSPASKQNAPAAKSGEKTSAAMAASAPPQEQPVQAGIKSVRGEILQGDSFRLVVETNGGQTFHIPVPVEGTRNIYTLDNTFKLVGEIAKGTKKSELETTFASFLVK
jgi:hypothetical protein